MFKTSYSFKSAFGMPQDVVPVIKNSGYSAAPIVDSGSTFGWLKWNEACKKNDIKPIFGVTLNVTDNIKAKKPIVDSWSFLAIDDIKHINELVRLATSQYRYTPLLTYEQALEAVGVVKIVGHKSNTDYLKNVDNLFIGLTPAISKGYFKKLSDFNFIQWQNNLYAKETDEFDAEVAIGRSFSLHTYPQHILSTHEWNDIMEGRDFTPSLLNEASNNLEKVLLVCNAKIKKGDLIRIKTEKTLEELCIEGANEVGIDLSDPVYAERLHTELKVIKEKNFEDYFFFVSDFMREVSKQQLVGPARGSSAGSLVCFLLGITQVDPIKYGLLFFRFLDIGRTDWPDIDLDFSNRDAAIEILFKKYGHDRVAKLGTTGNWQTQNTVNELSKSLAVNKYEIQSIVDSLPTYAANDIRKETALAKSFDLMDNGKRFIEKYPEFRVAGRMIGSPSHAAIHASGILVTSDPISEYVAVDTRPEKFVAMIDLHEAESIGLIKLDVLGVDSLAVLERAIEFAGLSRDVLKTIDLNDHKVFDTMNKKKYNGIFQFNAKDLSQLAKTTEFTEFEDFSVLSALCRPGASDGAQSFIRRKKGEEAPEYYHPLIEPFLKDTFGVLVYQEQTMLIAHDLAGMDWGLVSKLRKAIGKSMGEEGMRPFAEPFIAGLIKAGVDEDIAKRLWDDILRSGSYQFNASHSISYGLVSYWTAWMKTYYPVEFAAATLTLENDSEKQLKILRELDKEGVSYIPVDSENSTDEWRVVNGKLIGPLTLVEGLGPKMVQQILSARARNEPISERAQKLLTNPKTKIDSLYPVKEAIDKLDFVEHNITFKPKEIMDINPDGFWQDGVGTIGIINSCQIKSENDERRIQDRLNRGQKGLVEGQTNYVDIRLMDDTGEIFAKVGRKEFEDLWPKLEGQIEDGKTLLGVYGTVPPEIKMLLVKRLKVLGSL